MLACLTLSGPGEVTNRCVHCTRVSIEGDPFYRDPDCTKILFLNLDLGLKNTLKCKQGSAHESLIKIAYPVLIEEFVKFNASLKIEKYQNFSEDFFFFFFFFAKT